MCSRAVVVFVQVLCWFSGVRVGRGVLKSSPLLHTRDNERAYVSVNGKLCFNKVLHYSKGTNVCGHGHSGFKEEKIKVTCKGTLSKAGNLAVRVWTSLNQDAKDESFGIDNVVVTYATPKPGVAQTPTLNASI